MPEKLKGRVACLYCARPLSKWQFCFINRQMIGFIRSLLYVSSTFELEFIPYLELSVKFESQICHENSNTPLDGAYSADFGIV